jgi:hypothetical protein
MVISASDPCVYDYSNKKKGQQSIDTSKQIINKSNVTSFSINTTQKYINMHVSEVTVSNVNDWDEQLTMESHLGDRLREGDIVEGYDLR